MKKKVLSVMLAACTTTPTAPNTPISSAPVSEETTAETTTGETTTVVVAKKVPENPNLFGNPDKESATAKGLMKSSEVEVSWVSDLFGYTSLIDWVDYSPIVAGSAFTIEFLINDEITAGSEINLYLFEKNDEYAWDTELAVAKFVGSACNTVDGHEYWCDTILPDNIATGDYTLVLVRGDGTVDSMIDLQIVSSVDETTYQAYVD